MIRHASEADLPAILQIYRTARHFMAANGNPTQWGTSFPPREMLEEDVQARQLYVLSDGADIHGAFAFILGDDPTYQCIEGAWRSDTPYGAIHRLASDGVRSGVFADCLAYCKRQIPHLRIDTHKDNAVMRHLIPKHGFLPCGIVHVSDGTDRLAYEYLPRRSGLLTCFK